MTVDLVAPPALVEPFDLCGPLPTGTTVLEASAGTGKTFTIAALAARYVAEGHARLDQLMLVTFGRAATRELRERVRERFVGLQRLLADPVAARTDCDDLVRLLAAADDDEVATRHARIAAALADFDAATIDTTHAFCQQMLTGLGIAAVADVGGSFVENIDVLVGEVADDLYLRKWGKDPEPPSLTYGQARTLARCVVSDRHAVLEPAGEPTSTVAGQRLAFATAVRAEVEERKRRRRIRDFDDLLTDLHRSFTDPVTGDVARRRVRDRYEVVLVDEFQDTDPVQWEILRLAFHGHTRLVLIGDPKQSIYAFRGGDVTTYLAAARHATTERTLARNFRSDAGVLTALEQVFGGAALGHPRIVVRPVDTKHREQRLTGGRSAALRVRCLPWEVTTGGEGDLPPVAVIRDLVARDVARDIVELLSGGSRLEVDVPSRPVQPGDIAVLVSTHVQAAMVRASLGAAGVPAVLSGAASVYSTPMAGQWLVLLRALEQPHSARLARGAALTHFVGWDADQLSTAGDTAMDELGPLLGNWADVLGRRGVPALIEQVSRQTDLAGRLLGSDGGERLLTDLRHLGDSLHTAMTVEHVGAGALLEWLRRQVDLAGSDVTEERSRRLESDADAVQVVTIHRCKGLEFPITYVPYAWDRFAPKPDVPRFHAGDVRSLDVGGTSGAGFAEHCAAYATEQLGEDLRQLYVAFTRAQCQVVTWWSASKANTFASPLHRLLFGRHEPGAEPAPQVAGIDDDEAVGRLEQLSAAAAGNLVVERVDPLPPQLPRWRPPPVTPPELVAARFDRSLDTTWRRTSYTALTAAAYEASHVAGRETGERALDDDDIATAAAASTEPTPREGEAAGPDEDALRAVLSPMAELPAGTGFGLVVHSVLEQADPAAPDLRVELAERAREVLDRRLTRSLSADDLAAALVPAMQTPLGPLLGDRALRDVARGDRLAELDFELPLAGGDDPTDAAATVRAVADLLRRRLPAGDLLVAYPDRLDALDDQALRGYLVGSLDAVLRVADGADGADGDRRYVVADYKTNWLGAGHPGSGEPLTAWHYRPEAVTSAMLDAHYPLQALLYLVALHRYLRWRQPGYEPDRHLGGVLYLFIRGMCGPDTPVVGGVPCGVFGWRPPAGLVDELSALLAGEPS